MPSIIFILTMALTGLVFAQEPNEEAVSHEGLQGTLSLPEKKSKTAILLISGSGPTDRDGNSALGLTNNSLKMLAHALTNEGYPVLRYDKRGIAESSNAISSIADLRFSQLIEDASNWLSFLEKRGYKKLIVIGHSQGSLVGMTSAQNNPKVKGFISLAGLGMDAGTVILEQLKERAPGLADDASVMMDSLRAGHEVKKVNPYLLSLFGPQVQGFLKSYIEYDPKVEIAKLEVPALIINGTTDIQVPVDQAKMLNEAYSASQLVVFEGMNHILKDAPLDAVANMATYNDPDLPLSDGLLDSILTFIQSL